MIYDCYSYTPSSLFKLQLLCEQKWKVVEMQETQRPVIGKLLPKVQSSPSPVLSIKFYWNTVIPILVHIIYVYFHIKVQNCVVVIDYMAPLYVTDSLAHCRKSSVEPALEHPGKFLSYPLSLTLKASKMIQQGMEKNTNTSIYNSVSSRK